MNKKQIADFLRRRYDLSAIYLCSIDERTQDDVHLLGFARKELENDIHIEPQVSRFDRRLEVSILPVNLLEGIARNGITSWIELYTLDKLTHAEPLYEDEQIRHLRQSLIKPRIRPSLVSSLLKEIDKIRGRIEPGSEVTMLLETNLRLLLSLSLYLLTARNDTYYRVSQIVLKLQPEVSKWLGQVGEPEARSRIEGCSLFLKTLFEMLSIRVPTALDGEKGGM